MPKNLLKSLHSLRSIISFNTAIAVFFAVGATLLSLEKDWHIDFPLTVIGIAVVFPIVFSIGGAYNRRETALIQYGMMKSMGRNIYYASRDWLRDTDDKAKQNQTHIKEHFHKIFSLCIQLFSNHNRNEIEKEEQEIYHEFGRLSHEIEAMRDRGLSGSEVSRVNQYFNKFVSSFETVKHIYQYRTPRTLRVYSKFYIYAILLVLGPYFAMIGDNQPLWLALIKPVLFAMVFTGLDNIQEHLENPFDQVGEDDIKINPDKFIKMLDA